MVLSDKATTKAKNRFVSLEFELNKVHNNRYSYLKSEYINTKTAICITCPDHGDFYLTPHRHLSGAGCSLCKEISITGHISVSKHNLIHNTAILIQYLHEKYPLFSEFSVNNNVWSFKCSKHGYVTGTALTCCGCRKENRLLQSRLSFKAHIDKREETVLEIHDEFVILQCEHCSNKYSKQQLYGNIQLCKLCKCNGNRLTNDEFIARVISRFGNVWHIDETNYISATQKINLFCDKHGGFSMLPSNVLKGQGCKKCSCVGISKPEKELCAMIENAEINDRTLISPKEIDVLSREFKLCIEYDGLMWHSIGKHRSSKFNNFKNENLIKYKHLNKTNAVENRGYQLLHIFEDEWINNKKHSIWESIINGKTGNHIIAPDSFEIKEIVKTISDEFLNDNHIQGSCDYSVDCQIVRLGLVHNKTSEVFAVMEFSKNMNCLNDSDTYELTRYCSKLNYTVVNPEYGPNRLLEYFKTLYMPKSITVHVNRRWDTGELFETLGFEFIKSTEPDCFYFKINENILYTHDKISELLNKNGIQLLNNIYDYGYRKIYDSGKKILTWNYK